jgi:hypothetical protein
MSEDYTKHFLSDDPIELGSILFTMVEPDKGHEVAYNRWYERDHLYSGVMIGPYSLAAGRFVSTRDLKGLRYPSDSPIIPDPSVGSYLAIYFILKGHHDEWWRWGRRQVKVLIDADRMFDKRTHIHTQLYDYKGAVSRDGDEGVPAELALDHRFPGLVVVIGRANGDRDEAITKLKGRIVSDVLRGSKTALCLHFAPFPMPPGQPSDVAPSVDDEVRFLQLFFTDVPPDEAWDETFAKLDQSYGDTADVIFASPFKHTVPGTDTYTDQLW